MLPTETSGEKAEKGKEYSLILFFLLVYFTVVLLNCFSPIAEDPNYCADRETAETALFKRRQMLKIFIEKLWKKYFDIIWDLADFSEFFQIFKLIISLNSCHWK